DLQAPRHAAAFAHDVEAERPLRILRFEIHFAGGDLRTLRDDHEILDQLLHRGEHLVLRRRKNLSRIFRIPVAAGKILDDLANDANGLAHLFAPDEITIIAVPLRADGYVELVLFV